jgi:hypothetical protein
MALLASNGLPSTWATQIYLCGIHSRIVATELAVRIEKPHQIERLSEVFHYIKQFVNTILADTRISDLAKEWMKTLTNETQLNLKTVVKLPNFYFKKSADEVPDILFCRKYKDHVYLCSDDMTYKRIVNDNNNLKFSEVADMPGVYFEKADENLWKMVNVNPYVEIDGE